MRGAPYLVALAGSAAILAWQFFVPAPDIGRPGGPIEGLTADQLRLFYATRETFKHEFTPEEGLGPLFNGRSCYECHGSPGPVGMEGRDVVSTGVVRIANRVPGTAAAQQPLDEVIETLNQDNTDRLFSLGGPAISRKSITEVFPTKFPAGCIVEATVVPPRTELISLRHSPPTMGLGLIEAIPDADISQNVFRQAEVNKKLTGRLAPQKDPLSERLRIGRFGWKNQFPNLMLFTAEALRTEHGITTYIQPFEKFGSDSRQYPQCIKPYLPAEPNDRGAFINKLTYHQALLAPPPRGPITDAVRRGEKLFDRLQCSVCHVPTMYTAAHVKVVHPDSPVEKLRYIEVEALESKPVHAYSDFLLHGLGRRLADGVPQNGALGGEWRTAPLWGLRFKRFYLHDGRTADLDEAISFHGGQAAEVRDAYTTLRKDEKADLHAFLRSL